MNGRQVLVVAHTGRPAALTTARAAAAELTKAGIGVRVLDVEESALGLEGVQAYEPTLEAARDAELVLVFGGDGTLLRAAEIARPAGTPLLGVNLGHIGFLAEAEKDDVRDVVEGVLRQSYEVEERMTIDVDVCIDNAITVQDWALNEASVEKSARERMIELVAEVDGRPLSRYGCDGAVCATPTGSTAYAFSAGGPIVFPAVEALLLVPISAHALFSRPLVVGPDSRLAIEVLGNASAVLCCDGRRTVGLPPGARVEVRKGSAPVLLARLHPRTFADRLVAKFDLPVQGWRGRSA